MARRFRRPDSEAELKEREAAGLWRAQALAKDIGESRERITIDVIRRIHAAFLEQVNPDIAGRFRGSGEDFKKLYYLRPPSGAVVQQRMHEFWRELDTRLSLTPKAPQRTTGKKSIKKNLEAWNDRVIDLAAWAQHQIVAIHPFCEGNGRMARIMTNLILYRFKLQPTDVKYEGDNKEHYLKALRAMDEKSDLRPLKQLIVKGMQRSYEQLRDAQKRTKMALENK